MGGAGRRASMPRRSPRLSKPVLGQQAAPPAGSRSISSSVSPAAITHAPASHRPGINSPGAIVILRRSLGSRPRRISSAATFLTAVLITSLWDDTALAPWPRNLARGTGAVAAFLAPHLRGGMRLIDCGCGPGSITVDLAQAVAPGEAIGVDLREDALIHGRTLAREDRKSTRLNSSHLVISYAVFCLK